MTHTQPGYQSRWRQRLNRRHAHSVRLAPKTQAGLCSAWFRQFAAFLSDAGPDNRHGRGTCGATSCIWSTTASSPVSAEMPPSNRTEVSSSTITPQPSPS